MVQIPLRVNFLSNLYSVKNMIILGVQGQDFSHILIIYIYI